LAIGLFLALNGRQLTADRVDAVRAMLALAGGEMAENQLARWIGRNQRRRPRG
jgi:prophage maintenance system killer protein